MSSSPENLTSSPESSVEHSEAASERLEKLAGSPENSIELSPRDAEAAAERARTEALETAISVEAGGKERAGHTERTAPRHRQPVNKKQKEASFKKQMKEVQAELPPASRAFSKVIHNKAVERTSEVLGSTVARPNAILAGAMASFFLTLAVYVIAKNIGYKLSGFETMAAFAIGWVIGIVYDYLRIIVTGKK